MEIRKKIYGALNTSFFKEIEPTKILTLKWKIQKKVGALGDKILGKNIQIRVF